ncbi:MAG: hypothetical protein AAF559_07490 [Pseudomonadota bacterium]
MELLNGVFGGFLGLVILSLVWLTLGFALDSGRTSPEVNEVPPSRFSEFVLGAGWSVLCCVWLVVFADEWNDSSPDLWRIAITGAMALIAAANALKSLRKARSLA